MPRQARGLNKVQRKQVKKLVEAPLEKKKFHASYQDANVTATHVVSEICNIGQGDTEATRDGDAIKITSAFYRGHIVAADQTNVVRLTLIRWKPNGTPSADKIYETAVIGTDGGIYSDFNHQYRSDFVVLQDKFITVQGTNGQCQRMFTLKCGHQPKTVFNGSATTGANKLFLIKSSDSLAATHPTITMRGELFYTDA